MFTWLAKHESRADHGNYQKSILLANKYYRSWL